MIERYIQKKVEGSLKRFPVVGISGSRQAGKTTLSKKILKNYYPPISSPGVYRTCS
ncbi:MAG: hypothetical protein HZA08_14050 [Nitrospirae bacterium]|nr:hypothetical protein [Nitrospirota bacterium]